jgi:predicted dehydrogenase
MKQTRREFLHDTLIALTLLANGSGAGRTARASDGSTSDETIRVAVLGVRSHGRTSHLPTLAALPNVEVAAVCDVDLAMIPPALETLADLDQPTPRVYQDFRWVLDDPDIHALTIATPTHWHALAGVWAMQSGKDVYVEKPVCHEIQEGKILVEAAKKYGRICQAGTQARSIQTVHDAFAFLDAGKIGTLRLARALVYRPRESIGHLPPGEVPDTVDYNLWLGPAHEQPFHQNKFHYNWHWQWNTGNGDVANLGIHALDLARWGLKKTTFPRHAFGLGGRYVVSDDGETPNTDLSLFDYEDSQILLEVRNLPSENYVQARFGDRFEKSGPITIIFEGDSGYLVLPLASGAAAFDRDLNLLKTFPFDPEEDLKHFTNFVECVRTRNADGLYAPIREGYLSTALCHLGNLSYQLGTPHSFSTVPSPVESYPAAHESYLSMVAHLKSNDVDLTEETFRMGRVLEIDPVKETFVQDQEADALLSREARAPFSFGEAPSFEAMKSGDVDGDGKVQVTDAIRSLQYITGKENPTALQKRVADMNRDEALDVTDVILSLRKAAGL